MRACVALALVCLAVIPLGCGGSDSSTNVAGESTGPAEQAAPSEQPVSVKAVPLKTGSFAAEGPFAAISLGKPNEKPRIDPADRPPPKTALVRELRSGSGPAARIGDEVGMYYAGAVYETGKVKYYAWPPARPTVFELGSGTVPQLYKWGLVGLRVGGIREVIAPSSLFNGSGAVDYVIALVSLRPASEDP